MTGQHIANQCKLIFSEYGWPETLVSDNGPCYTAEVSTNLMKEYNVNGITSSPHYQMQGLSNFDGIILPISNLYISRSIATFVRCTC